MSKKVILLIIILILVGISAAFVIYQYEQPSSTNVMKGSHSLLLLTIDPSEQRAGMGAVDMAFVIKVVDGDVKNITPVYPGGMRHPTVDEPAETGAGGGKLLLHDSFWNAGTEQDAKLAQEIVQYNTNMTTDGVVIVTPDAIDAMIAAVGPIDVPGQGSVTGDTINFLRGEQDNGGMSRGNAVESIMKPLINATKDPTKYTALAKVAVDQYLKGNIVVIPKDLMTQFAISKGLKLV